MSSIGVFNIFLILGLLLVYLIPSFIALKINHPNKVWIIITNIFGGLFAGIGWVAALIWCVIRPGNYTPASVIDQLQQLNDLKEQGVITEDEFNAKKHQLLHR